MASQPIYKFYAELDDYKPKIWRRFQVSSNIKVARLGYIIMALFEMKASHLFCFEQLKDNVFTGEEKKSPKKRRRITADDIIRYEIVNEELFSLDSLTETRDAAGFSLKQAMPFSGGQMTFGYDFGDDWRISLLLEDIINDTTLPAKELPHVLEGGGFGIVEDCGGIYGLEELAKAFKVKKGPQYDDFRSWLGVDDLNLEAFDISDMNFRLKKIPRIFADIYEKQLEPTQKSIDLLDRKYKSI